jgi:hypothetical protein
VDETLHLLGIRFRAAKAALDTVEGFMNPEERGRIQQLRSFWAGTLAASHYGIGDFVRLGAEAAQITHRQPLEAYARTVCGNYGWTDEKKPEK